MILRNVQIVGQEGVSDIVVNKARIKSVTPGGQAVENQVNLTPLEFNNALAFPGLINSHDHLDFNLFPSLGNRVYKNYTEWGKDIHDNNRQTIHAILKIPPALRIQWGLYKNLLSGVTTVVNHGKQLEVNDRFITVLQDCYNLHSVAFERNWKYKLNNPLNNRKTYVMHVGEGTDSLARREIKTLLKWNLFNRKIIGVHGVSVREQDAEKFRAIVWCPASNFFLLNATASIDRLKMKTDILFGTDSTLTAGWNIWDHLRLARGTSFMEDDELFDTFTETAAQAWGLNCGRLKANAAADIIIANNQQSGNAWEDFYRLNPADIQAIFKAGKIVLFDESMHQQLLKKRLLAETFSPICIAGKTKFVTGELPALAATIKKYHPGIMFPFE